jgi:hypothetical protein
MAARAHDLGELILNYDPLQPQPQFFRTATALLAARSRPAVPEPVPWPAGGAPVPDAPTRAPAPSAPLPRCDALVVTWTVAEARALAALFTPGVQLEGWFEYTHKVADFIPKVRGPRAPFNSRGPHNSNLRYYHSLGLYYPCRVGPAKVLCFKSGLHPAYDGPDVPLKDLWGQLLDETGCSVVITTGTAGGIGADIKLGDVVIGRHTVFDCNKQFKNKPFAHASYPTSTVAASAFRAVTGAMLKPNADRLPPATRPPKFWSPASAGSTTPNVVTTDFFAYDNTTDTNHLQGLGNVCEMGDAVLGLALEGRANKPTWFAIRNASDPQIDGSLPKAQQDAEAGRIYQRYGTFTTASSVLATWAIIRHAFPGPGPLAPRPKDAAARAANGRAAPPPPSASEMLLTLASGRDLAARDVAAGAVPAGTITRLKAELKKANVSYASSDVSFREVSFTDELGTPRRLHLANVSNDEAEAFRGSYLFEGEQLITKEEFVSG